MSKFRIDIKWRGMERILELAILKVGSVEAVLWLVVIILELLVVLASLRVGPSLEIDDVIAARAASLLPIAVMLFSLVLVGGTIRGVRHIKGR